MAKQKKRKQKRKNEKMKKHVILKPVDPPQPLQAKKGKSNTKKIIVYLSIIIGIFLILNILTLSLQMPVSPLSTPPPKTASNAQERDYTPNTFFQQGNATIVEMKLPAIDTNKTGVTTTLVITAMPGSGRTLVDIDGLLFWADTQQSIRTARQVAAQASSIDADNYDIIYSIKAQASVIGGPSAGAALTIATIAALTGQKPASDIMMTGAINHDGSIGPVSEILQKAKAAKEAGATAFLVPLQQGKEVVYETREHCENYGSTEFCTEETYPRRVSVSEEAGIKIIEVASIEEAMEYFFKKA